MYKTKYLTPENQAPTMAESILGSLLLAFGIPMFIGAWLADILMTDIDPIKSWVVFVGGGLMTAIGFVFKVDKWYHSMWMRKMERRKIMRELEAKK